MKNNEKSTTPSELLHDLQALVGEAEAMITDSVSEHSADAIESLQTRFHAAQARFAEAYAGARKKVVAGAKCTDTAIRENPYQALAIAGGIGLLLGVLLGRRSK